MNIIFFHYNQSILKSVKNWRYYDFNYIIDTLQTNTFLNYSNYGKT